MRIVALAASLLSMSSACVPSPEYSGRRLDVDREQQEEEEEADAGIEQQQQMQQPGPHDTGVPAVVTHPDAAEIDAGIADAGGSGEADAEPMPMMPDAGEPGQVDSGPSGQAGFGATCTGNGDCASGVCRNFNQLGLVCTQICAIDVDCPAGSMGQKCNMQGLCRP